MDGRYNGGIAERSSTNIVVLMADQHRADFLGCAGAPGIQTPAIDRLAAEGARFTRVNCQGPLCMPARASFLTERYVRDHGVYSNWAELEATWPTYVRALSDAGLHTVQLGKAHLYRDDMYHVAHVDDLAPRITALGFDEVHEGGDKYATKIPNAYTDFLAGRGLLDAYQRHIRDRAYQGESETGVGATKRVPMWDASAVPLPLDAYFDHWQGEQAVRWIEEYDGDKPFFAFVGFPGPHDPWDAPMEARARYEGVDVIRSASTKRPDPDAAGPYGRMLKAFLSLSDSRTMDDDAVATMRAAYAANVSIIDDAVGRIVAALDAKGVLDDTWIVYTSDHGESAGDHGLMSKCVFYLGPTRVPLIVRPPGGMAPIVVDDIVEHVDVPATLRAAVGAPACPDGEGRSLLGYLHGTPPARRELSISENWGFALFETDRYKLVVDEDTQTPCQLLDLVEDPAEDVNALLDQPSVVSDLMDAYVRPFLATPPARPHPGPFA